MTGSPASRLPASRPPASRLPAKYANDDRAGLAALIDEARVGHCAFVVDGQPNVLPIAIARYGDSVLLHGSTGSRWLRLLATGIPVALSVTELDALVVARSAFESSMHYRSAVLFGSCAVVPEAEKVACLDAVTEALLPGRAAEVRRHTAKELAATLIMKLTVDDFTFKVSNGWPEDPDDDVAGEAWAGVLPLTRGFGAALPAPDLRVGIPVPESVRRLSYSPA
jgi:nitroimidazol reductase NimA-like FMN-containing flavoprotein (pyridoxamine 5'-phosphate oxidase superfamily)